MDKTEALNIVKQTTESLSNTRTALLKFIADVAGTEKITFKEPSTITLDGETAETITAVAIDATHVHTEHEWQYDIADEFSTDTLQCLADELYRAKFGK